MHEKRMFVVWHMGTNSPLTLCTGKRTCRSTDVQPAFSVFPQLIAGGHLGNLWGGVFMRFED